MNNVVANTLIVAGLLVGLTSGCLTSMFEPETQMEQEQVVTLLSEWTEAQATETLEDDKLIEAKMSELEDQIFRRKAGPFVAGLSLIPVVGPWVAQGSPFVLTLLGLLGKRKRKHYGNMLGDVNPQSPRKFTDIFTDFAKAEGWIHSSPDSEAAFAKEELSAI